jgi:hypothetical protein
MHRKDLLIIGMAVLLAAALVSAIGSWWNGMQFQVYSQGVNDMKLSFISTAINQGFVKFSVNTENGTRQFVCITKEVKNEK